MLVKSFQQTKTNTLFCALDPGSSPGVTKRRCGVTKDDVIPAKAGIQELSIDQQFYLCIIQHMGISKSIYNSISNEHLWNRVFPERDLSKDYILPGTPIKIILFGNGLTLRFDRNFLNKTIVSYSMKTVFEKEFSEKFGTDIQYIILKTLESGITSFEEIFFKLGTASKALSRLGFIPKQNNYDLEVIMKAIKHILIIHINGIMRNPKILNFSQIRNWYLRFNGIFTLNYDIYTNLALEDDFRSKLCYNFFEEPKRNKGNPRFQKENNKNRLFSVKNKNCSFFNLHGSLLHSLKDKHTYYKRTDQYLEKDMLIDSTAETCVIGGDGDSKREYISKNDYLAFCFDQFSTVLQNDYKKDILIFGAGLTSYDSHIVDELKKANNAKIYFQHMEADELEISDEKRNLYHYINDRGNSEAFFVYIPRDRGLPFESSTNSNET